MNRGYSRFIEQIVATIILFSFSGYSSNAQTKTPEIARALSINLGLQGRVVWIDATANLDRICTIGGVRDVVARCAKANISTIVVDAKPVCGMVTFNSKIAAHLVNWKGKAYPDFDILGAFVEEGHKAGLEVAATFNVLAEGHKYFKVGLAYEKPDWQSVSYIVERKLVARDGDRLSIRAVGEPEDPAASLVQTNDYIVMPTEVHSQKLAVEVDEERRVAGVIDPALLGDEPLAVPDDGQVLLVANGAMDWATQHLHAGDPINYEAQSKLIPVTDSVSEKIAAFVNPLQPEARKYELSLLQEVARNYDVDAIVFDRMRYANIYNDFSNITRAAFERWLGKPVGHWPEDILAYDPVPGEPIKRGPLFRQWLEFRARVIREFASEATESIRAIKPNIQFGAYEGSWFTEYYGVGVNWGSEKFPVRSGWASPSYNEAGIAEFLDWVATGCYYPIATREDARSLHREEGGTVEAAADLSKAVVLNAIPAYAGIYVLNYAGNPDGFTKAINTATRHSMGVMIFDLSYIYDYDWWNLLEQAFPKPAMPPHKLYDLTAQLREVTDEMRAATDARSSAPRLPAVPYQSGGG